MSPELNSASLDGEKLIPLVLVENDVTIGGNYDGWLDRTGEQYHFPNQYRNRVQEGRRFIYYRGVRRRTGRGVAEYFGCGRIGLVWRDDSVAVSTPKNRWKWFCAIDDYTAFPNPVSSRQGSKYLEAITHSRGWQVGVREVPETVYQQIVSSSGLTSDPLAPSPVVIEPSTIVHVTNLLKIKPRVALSTLSSTPGPSRRSRDAIQVGRAAEQLVFDLLRRTHPTAKWLSEEGELPGYDIGYEVDGQACAVEVKGTTGMTFPCIEFTANEWRAAQELRNRFFLYLVAECRSTRPKLQVVQDPFALFERGEASVEPIVLRFIRRSADA